MRLGLIARSADTGLGNQTLELYRHLQPARTLVVQVKAQGARKLEEHPERFPDARVAGWDGQYLAPYDRDWLLTDIDVLLTCETPYDYELLHMAHARGISTAVVGNYEFLRWRSEPELPRPDLFVAPSRWHLQDWPEGTVHLPHPVDRQRCAYRPRERALRFLHVAGQRAMQDRAGTRLVEAAARLVRSDVQIVVRSQRPSRPIRTGRARSQPGNERNYWQLYDDFDVLLAPRRYGGQSLPLAEAMSCGMPVVALDRFPDNELVPAEALVPATRPRELQTQAGPIGWYDARPQALATVIDRLATEPELVQRLSERADAWAAWHSWEHLGPKWRQLLELLAEHRRIPA